MRYIGNKTSLLNEIKNFIDETIPCYDNQVFCDIFSGTSSVARFFKKDYITISNDYLYFSYVLQEATIHINKLPSFSNLIKELKLTSLDSLFSFLNTFDLDEIQSQYGISTEDLFVYNNYTPATYTQRMYFIPEVGKRIDLIRILINRWYNEKLIDYQEYMYLLACLIETVPFYSNISGVYGAYLKHWDKRVYKDFNLVKLKIYNNNKNNSCYNEDAHNLIKKIKGDILYLDPPYNNRQYPPNYHVLETIARYDYPKIKGISGMRDYSDQISKFCRKNEVKSALEDIIKNANFEYIVMSYSTDGILTSEDIKEIFIKYGIKETFKMGTPIKYRKFKNKQKQKKKELHELLFFIKKDVSFNKNRTHRRKREIQTKLDFSSDTLINNMNKSYNPVKKQNNFLKSPINYIGNKYKLLPQLIYEFPDNISTFVDLFGGSCTVGINVCSQKKIYNDQITPLVDLFKYFQENEYDDTINYIQNTIEKFNIKKEDKQGFLNFRDYYNNCIKKHPLDLFILSSFSFNYQIRFNNSGEYNCSHGTNRSSFNKNMQKRLKEFMEKLHDDEIYFYNNDFRDIDFDKLDSNSLVYCDPPYLITTGSYNDGNRGFKNWTLQEESDLLDLLVNLNDNKVNFALSNVVSQDGKKNNILLDWIDNHNFKVIPIDSDYSNSNYQKNYKKLKNNSEVLIVNY